MSNYIKHSNVKFEFQTLLRILEQSLLDVNKGKVGCLKTTTPCENEELLDFRDYLVKKLLSIISCIFRNEISNDISEFALKNVFDKIDKMHAKEGWTFEDINFEFQNLNYYMTNLDVIHLTECMHNDPLECQDIPFDKRHELFYKLKCTSDIQASIINRRKRIYDAFKDLYVELTMAQSRILIEKWYYDVPNFDHLESFITPSCNEKDIKTMKQLQLNSKSITQKLFHINDCMQRFLSNNQSKDIPWSSSQWCKSLDQDFKSVGSCLQQLAGSFDDSEQTNQNANENCDGENEEVNPESTAEIAAKIQAQDKSQPIEETVVFEGFGKVEEKKVPEIHCQNSSTDTKDMASIMWKLRKELNKKLEETREINDKEHVITKYM